MGRWLLPLALVGMAALRLPLLLLPGAGRDEAAYHSWAHSIEPAYAPILQILIRLGEALGLAPLANLRLIALLGGGLTLFLLDRWLRAREVEASSRHFGIALIGLCAWQTQVGSLLHPDAWLMVGALGAAWSGERSRIWPLVFFAALALWAKPSGLAISAAGLYWFVAKGQLWPALTLVALCIPPLWGLDPHLLGGMLEFGHFESTLNVWLRMGLALVGLFFLLGPMLPFAWMARRPAPPTVAVIGAQFFLLAFSLAAIAGGQLKANWIAPALVLLWPERLNPSRRMSAALLLATALPALAISLSFSRPDLLERVEGSIGAGPLNYETMAGPREAEVSAARSWSDRAHEYRSLAPLRAELEALLPDVPMEIVSDDYGLASQLQLAWHGQMPQIFLPADRLFDPRDGTLLPPTGSRLLIETHPLGKLSAIEGIEALQELAHPYAPTPLRLGWDPASFSPANRK